MPGAVTIRAANYLYNEAAKDGTVIGMVDQGIYLNQISRSAPVPRRHHQVQLDRPHRQQQRGALFLA